MSNQFEITSIELSHDYATELLEHFSIAISETEINELDRNKGKEFEWHSAEETIAMVLNVEFFSEYEWVKDRKPCKDRSVTCTLKMYNQQGSEVQYTVKGESVLTESNNFFTKSPIDICYQIEREFSI